MMGEMEEAKFLRDVCNCPLTEVGILPPLQWEKEDEYTCY